MSTAPDLSAQRVLLSLELPEVTERTPCSFLSARHGHRLSEFIYLAKKRGLAQSQPGKLSPQLLTGGPVHCAGQHSALTVVGKLTQ